MWLPTTLQHDVACTATPASKMRTAQAMGAAGRHRVADVWLACRPRRSRGRGGSPGAVRRAVVEARAATIEDADRRAYVLRERLELLPGGQGFPASGRASARRWASLMITAAIVLLIGCANLASLVLARGAARGREFALRLALGAGRGRIVRQLLTESLVLAGSAAWLGRGRSLGERDALAACASSEHVPRFRSMSPFDWRLVAFTFGVSVLTGLAFGLMPALRLSRA